MNNLDGISIPFGSFENLTDQSSENRVPLAGSMDLNPLVLYLGLRFSLMGLRMISRV
jgi:hypothetical protein